jgi:hypothetical protein
MATANSYSSDVTQASEQEAIADSLVSADGAEPFAWGHTQITSPPPDEDTERYYFSEYEREQDELADTLVSERKESPDELTGAASREELEALGLMGKQEQSEQAEAPAPQSFEQKLESIDSVIEKNVLHTPEMVNELASGLSFNIEAADQDALGRAASRTVLSAGSLLDGQGQQIANHTVSPMAAKIWANDFLPGIGIDPRTTNVDTQALAQTVMDGTLNILDTIIQKGSTDIRQINEADAAMHFATRFAQAFGHANINIDRREAVDLADQWAKYVVGMYQRAVQVQTKQKSTRAQAQPQQRKQSRGKPAKTGKSYFQTNNDIFDTDTMDRVSTEMQGF